ncbi:glycosyltransferase [Flavobacterium sp. SM15]|uniref:glycosyltransferase n=1 Tax=Flavobacterium sp. SM15 TaxID=2908005 RepID=UPI001EDA4389|nr:glycosyltransferase [Flavobacterium sp. SM15]MCG2611284.1 glycosyltransferase [Flavobacterium sp. SM15]
MRKILFITWDGPQTSYMEGLFMPIFNEISKTQPVEFHVLQFTWAKEEKIKQIKEAATTLGIIYTVVPVYRKPIALVGSLLTVFKGISFVQKYIKKHQIEIVMPRSTMPAVMVNRLQRKNIKVIFDADGLPLEERVDFSGLSKESKQYIWLKSQETKLLRTADGVITRSQKAIEIHLTTIGEGYRNKFSVVFNGRNSTVFKPDFNERLKTREQLGFSPHEKIFVYCGSLGPQYGWEEMVTIFSEYHNKNNASKFLILTGNTEFAEQRLPSSLKESIKLISVPFIDVPKYLNSADIAFAIRKPTFSMQGVAPIKLGEYLLMGLPTIASAGIGDTESFLKTVSECLLFEHSDQQRFKKASDYLQTLDTIEKNQIRKIGMQYFSLERSAKSYIESISKLK